ncbi:hypothetical protein IAT40_005285 [Kwoniella sp. CBS 6097]
MPRLQILHHKSYHPYLEKNKQRVREDEARAQAEELAKEQKQLDTEAEARLDILRKRAGSPSFQPEHNDLPSTSSTRDRDGGTSLIERHRKEKAREEKREKKKRDRLDFDFPSESARRSDKGKRRAEEPERAEKWETGGHVNLFADIERAGPSRPPPTLAELAKVKKDRESDLLTMYLGRPDKETKPWYADRELKRVEDREIGEEAEERRARDRRKDARSKNRHDPLTHISTLLSTSKPKPTSHSRPSTLSTNPSDARRAREQTERERALALLGGPKGPPSRPNGAWNDTPSTISGDRTWEDDWERQKAKAGNRFFSAATRSHNGRSWEV